jgi:anti-anti-sigma regulatory factor
MNQKFQAVVHHREDVTYVKLSGVIDEDNELGDLVDRIGQGTTVIDLGEIERINSCGVRDWVNWLTKIERNGARPVLVECSPAIVAQINLVNNFTGNGVVKSFFAPYFCPSCDLEKVLLVETQEMMGQDPPHAPTCRCDECDGVMDFDDMEESYFAFLVQMKNKVVSSPRVDAVVAEFTPTDGDRKIRSRVGSSVTGSSNSSLPSVPSMPQISRGVSSAGLAAVGPGGASAPAPFPNRDGTGSGLRSFGGGSSGAYSMPGSAPGRAPSTVAVNVANPPGGYGVTPLVSSTRSRLYAVVVVLLLVVAIGLLTYAVFFAKSQPRVKIGTADGVTLAAGGPIGQSG